MLKRIWTEHLTPGMYVAELDRPWVETKFKFQGFMIRSGRDIALFRKTCIYVYVDAEQSLQSREVQSSIRNCNSTESIEKVLKHVARGQEYNNACPVERELNTAKCAYEHALQTVSTVWENAAAGKHLDAGDIEEAVTGIVESILRNPDALLLLRCIPHRSEYAYVHAVNCCALAAHFARHLSIEKQELYNMATGGLLFDIGKTRLPEALLNKKGPLSQEEITLMRQHVEFGSDILANAGGFSRSTIDMVRSHHERYDGEGYPKGTRDYHIPLHARMAAIIDCFDAITVERPYKKPVTSYDGLHMIYEANGIDFQKELAEQFIQCMRIYPTGSCVELTDGQVAVVVEQNSTQRMRPRVMLIRNQDGSASEQARIIDLANQSEIDEQPLAISKVLPAEYIDTPVEETILKLAA